MKLLFFLLTCLPLFGADHAKLLVLAGKWEVPQPHPQSKLVKIWVYYNSTGEYYSLGFVAPERPKMALVGFAWQDISIPSSRPPIMVPNINELSLEFIVASSPFGSPNGSNNGLLTAIQLIRHGYPGIGEKLLGKSLKSDAGHPHSPLRIKEGQSADLMLAQSCLAAATNAITSPKPDFQTIKRRIETLVADRPILKSKTTDWLLTSLTASVDHPKPKPDSLEALIDDYLLSGGIHGGLGLGENSHPARKELVLRGFKVIPTLIQHLDDKRMTNHLMQGFNNFSSYPMTADLVINSYLQSFANDEMGSNWLDRQKGYTSKKDAVLAWWKKASAMGEKAYVKRYTVTEGEKKKIELSNDLLLIAAARYPDLIPGFYSSLLKTKHQSYDVAGALGGHPRIPMETRKKLLLQGVATEKDEHRNSALRQLFQIDSKKAEALLLGLIKKGPKTTRGEYWTDQNARLTHFVSKTTNREIWLATEKYINRALLGMRMELLDHLSPPTDAPREVLQIFLRIHDRYASNKTLRKNSLSRKFDGPGAGFPYDKLELRNFIHIHYGRWLKVEARPPDREEQTPEKWAAFRADVSRAMLDYRSKAGLTPKK